MDVPVEDIAPELTDMFLRMVLTSVSAVNEVGLADFEDRAL